MVLTDPTPTPRDSSASPKIGVENNCTPMIISGQKYMATTVPIRNTIDSWLNISILSVIHVCLCMFKGDKAAICVKTLLNLCAVLSAFSEFQDYRVKIERN